MSACSTVPTSSPTVQITQAPTRPDGAVGIEPLPPPSGVTPDDVVRGFLDAAASSVPGHPVAREHLAPEPARVWSDESGITVLGQDYATVTTDSGSVEVTASVVGTIDQRGVFTVGGEELFTYEFTLQQVEAEWRITNPPDGLLILQPDFERLYERRDLYFIDPTGRRVVPDPRYLIGGDAQPTVLVERLLGGPSSTLAAGVGNRLAGTTLNSTVTVSAQTVTVDLAGLADRPPAELAELCAQLVWTLRPLARSVAIRADGASLDLEGVPAVQTIDDWTAFGPDAVPVDAVGHFVDAGALRTVAGEPAPGPAGAGAYGLTAAAVSADARTGELTDMVGSVVRDGQTTLLSGAYGGDLVPVLSGATLSAPTVAATRREFWVVRDGSAVVRVPAEGQAQAVIAPTLPGPGRATVLQLSPDGVRAAVVLEDAQGASLFVGTVVRSDEGPVALRDLREVAPTLTRVVDVAWRTAGSLLVLAGDADEGRIEPYSLGVDGWGLTDVPTSGLPSQPTGVAAAPGRPALVSADGTIWQLAGGTWVTLLRGQQPLPGNEPFYPM
nr:LpqB family beta-propeller domain-containing protein [Geodermatophilus sabuli]